MNDIALELDDTIYMYHNNFIIGKHAKEYRSKEMNTYITDVNEEYSSSTTKYLTFFEIPSTVTTYFDVDRAVEKRLKEAFVIAKALNRTLVIPPISCYNNTRFCNLCFMDDLNCFSKYLASGSYRESVIQFKGYDI